MENKIAATHTPTPWELAGRNGICEINDGKVIAEIKGFSTSDIQDEINAAYIVRAVNAHEELLAALDAIRARIHGEFDNKNLIKLGTLGSTHNDILELCDRAITKAEGQ